jgi:hypothetical protein
MIFGQVKLYREWQEYSDYDDAANELEEIDIYYEDVDRE